jgi:hypothetical protein
MRDAPNPPRTTGGPYRQPGQRTNARRQFKEIGYKTLVSYAGGEGDTDPGPFEFRITNPSSQVRTRIAINFEAGAGAPAYPDITPSGATVWVASSDDPRGGASSRDVPNSSVEGTKAAPTPFPSTVNPATGLPVLDPGLTGYTREFVTAGQYLIGQLSVPPTGFRGAWVLVVTAQPDGVELTDDAWNDICSMFSMYVGKAPA